MKKAVLGLVLAMAAISPAKAQWNQVPVQVERFCLSNAGRWVGCAVAQDQALRYGGQALQYGYRRLPRGHSRYYGNGYANSTPYYFNQGQDDGGCNQFLHNC
jgi:opacity protein-like surface antigen